MRRDLWCAAVAAFLTISGTAFARQNAQGQPSQNQAQQSQQAAPAPASATSPAAAPAAQGASQSTTATPPVQEGSLAAAARKAREQKKDQATAKPTHVFNNDNIPTQGGVSAVGQETAADGSDGTDASAAAGNAPAAAQPAAGADEKGWRDRFAKLRKKLEQDQTDLDLMQRELGVLDVQYYNDPVKGMQQGYSRSDIDEKTSKIDEKKKLIEADQQAIADAEDELHKAGGDPGWAR
ncbi:MAG: hypothetical protein WA192_08600 [Candidatus Acidiferrales bacterium]